uniref:Uncharacterized protein n=1 Tax=Globisporangium ultimum (strain ATCC 200006 / CBS 805.95 / DAOM BR144) TaxID=431595 RepID=K3WI32_GLOUD
MLLHQMLRHAAPLRASVRAFATEASESTAAVAPAAKSSGSSFVQRLTAFTVGFAVAGAIGLVQLNEDVEKSTQEIQKSISSLKSDVIAQNAALVKRIEQLEKRD